MAWSDTGREVPNLEQMYGNLPNKLLSRLKENLEDNKNEVHKIGHRLKHPPDNMNSAVAANMVGEGAINHVTDLDDFVYEHVPEQYEGPVKEYIGYYGLKNGSGCTDAS